MDSLQKYQKLIIEGIGRIRKERWLTQTEFANLLQLSQQQFSKIERGEGSISAEQFLLILHQFNLSLDFFVKTKPVQEDLILQNALARFGAVHLRETQGIFIPEKYNRLNEIIIDILSIASSSRLITALAPVLVKNIHQVNFNLIEKKLSDFGYGNRLVWVLENTLKSIQNRLNCTFLHREIKLLYRHVENILLMNVSYLEQKQLFQQQNKPEDILDVGITSQKTLEALKVNRDPIAQKWNIITSIKQSDFEEALKNTESL